MRVKNMMVLGKLCLILVCSNNAFAQSWESPIHSNWQNNDSFVGFAYNISKWFTKRLKPEDQALHSQAVYHALNNLDNGQVVEWWNDRTDAQGKARIMLTWTANGNICRRIYSWVRMGADEKSFEDSACFNNSINGWKFVDKY